ncbi:orotate phosphoribosyltransferase [Clostridiisalibacter paucivorans]|uniref:orotate phosphoribosyltransferase n=1 Tax=Clostridiisalibacter paucivorans TaxID=408753 RepID=UPI00047D02B6|nr:orotate phosphoribosyltransferase [Clostridiisalibacter paucivorans]
MDRDIFNLLKEGEAVLEGHFKLSSGNHSNMYIQCAKALQNPKRAEKLMRYIKEQIKDLDIDLIVGPAMGGIIAAYELARQMDKDAIFTERKDGIMQLRRGFSVKKGQKILICEDVITTGKSSYEVKRLLESMGAEVVGLACIVDRRASDCKFDLDIYSAIKLEIEIYEPGDCKLCDKGLELESPGSRFIK